MVKKIYILLNTPKMSFRFNANYFFTQYHFLIFMIIRKSSQYILYYFENRERSITCVLSTITHLLYGYNKLANLISILHLIKFFQLL